MNMEESNEVKVKNEPIRESNSIPDTKDAKRQSKKVKEEPIEKRYRHLNLRLNRIRKNKLTKFDRNFIGLGNSVEVNIEKNNINS